MISETKLNSSFPVAQFYMESCCQSCRLDRTDKGGGIMLYIREEIPLELTEPAYCKPDTLLLSGKKSNWKKTAVCL